MVGAGSGLTRTFPAKTKVIPCLAPAIMSSTMVKA